MIFFLAFIWLLVCYSPANNLIFICAWRFGVAPAKIVIPSLLAAAHLHGEYILWSLVILATPSTPKNFTELSPLPRHFLPVLQHKPELRINNTWKLNENCNLSFKIKYSPGPKVGLILAERKVEKLCDTMPQQILSCTVRTPEKYRLL